MKLLIIPVIVCICWYLSYRFIDYKGWREKCKTCYWNTNEHMRYCTHMPCDNCEFGSNYINDSDIIEK